mmetsp:Transcript_34540/g.74903  ORF Transcript_34540/g.74903 Transcript_34540/m.74903 type:complete len:692 (-) Transcript_34540:51-2126(-)
MSTSRQRKRIRDGRIILLLDLDCFYAQCETIRLGLDHSVPLCLLQWNSALAVNYPARAFGIKRGDGIDEIGKKSKGQCVALHLPVISVDDIAKSSTNDEQSAQAEVGAAAEAETEAAQGSTDITSNDGGDSSADLVQSYNAVYNLPQHVRSELFQNERNVMRYPHEGKASLERYRLASARIFSIITEALLANIGKNNFVLERASIDEIFLDVTEHCYDPERPAWGTNLEELTETAHAYTVLYGSTEKNVASISGKSEDVDEEAVALRRGCIVARGVRKAVHDALSFTLSAGISINKTVAKLGASYGKPDGQAVVYPRSIPQLMNETPIRKVRNMGGKVGRQVKALMPDDEDKMGSIARLLSLPELSHKLGRETAKRVFDVARGIDNEPVLETKGALTKSITAFKSFGATYLDGLDKWTTLLASDIVARVELDSKRNGRHPRSCNIQYTYSDGGGGGGGRSDRISRSARIAFPKASDRRQRLEQLIAKVKETLAKKDTFPVYRLGLSAIDFEAQSSTGAIDAFFSKQVASPNTGRQQEAQVNDEKDSSTAPVSPPAATAATASHSLTSSSSVQDMANNDHDVPSCYDPDLEYARKLQASYDKEEAMLSTLLDRSSKHHFGSTGSGGSGRQRSNKKSGQSFFGGNNGTTTTRNSISKRRGGGGGSSSSTTSSSGGQNKGSNKKGKIDSFFIKK